MLMQWFCLFFDFLYKSICCGYSFKLHCQVDAIQMGTHNICLYKEVEKVVVVVTTELLDCAVIGVVMRPNTVQFCEEMRDISIFFV